MEPPDVFESECAQWIARKQQTRDWLILSVAILTAAAYGWAMAVYFVT